MSDTAEVTGTDRLSDEELAEGRQLIISSCFVLFTGGVGGAASSVLILLPRISDIEATIAFGTAVVVSFVAAVVMYGVYRLGGDWLAEQAAAMGYLDDAEVHEHE